jgi:multidrug efflux pump subunit AcrB
VSIVKLGVKQPVLANMVALFAIVAGVVAYLEMPKRRMPIATANMAMVTTLYPGASPQDVDRLISSKIQAELSDLEDVKEITSLSREGMSSVFVEYDAEVGDFDRVMIDLAAEVDKVKNLPASVDPPEAEQLRIESTAIYVAVSGTADERVLREVSLDLRDELERIDGVSRAEFMAWREREVWVELDPELLDGHRLTPDEVSRAIANENRNVPGGVLRSGDGELLVRTEGEFQQPEEISEVVVYRDNSGGVVRVADVAHVVDTFEEHTRRTRLNGKEALVMQVYSANSADAFVTVESIREVLEDFESVLPPGVQINTFLDSTESIRESLMNLIENALFGLLLVGLLLWLFMGLRTSLMAVVGLPVAILGGVALLSLMDVSVNRLTLFAMILILGILVDDAIVVIENVERHMGMAKSRVDAAIDGTLEVLWPVLSATATTLAAFSSLFWVTGVMGQFLASIPKVVIAALVASLIEALFILPSHAAQHGRAARQGTSWRTRTLAPLQRRYLAALQWTLANRYLAVSGAVAISVGFGVLGASLLDIKLSDQDEPEVVEVRLEMAPGTRLDVTSQVLDELDRRIATLPSEWVADVLSVTGFSRQTGPGTNVGGQYGQMYVLLTPASERDENGFEILAQLRGLVESVPGPVLSEVVAEANGPPTGAPVSIRMRGGDPEVLSAFADRVEAQLSGIRGVEDIQSNLVPGKKEMRVRVDRRAAAMVGLSGLEVANHVRTAHSGRISTQLRTPRGEIDVRVKMAGSEENDAGTLESMMLPTSDGRIVPLREIARIEEQLGDSAITRVDGKRTIIVNANVDERITTGVAVNRALAPFLAELRQERPDFNFEAGGEFEMTKDSVASMLRALLIAAVVIFAILAAQFRSYVQPVIVMAALPFSFVGVVLGLIVSDVSLSLFSMMGIIALAGIVVNDSLVLVDFVNGARRRGENRFRSILEAGSKRLRAILLTTVTTMAGLLPLAYSFFGRDEMLGPMAVAIVWGVAVATLLTLLLVPALYAIVDDLHALVMREDTVVDDRAILSAPVDDLIASFGGPRHSPPVESRPPNREPVPVFAPEAA